MKERCVRRNSVCLYSSHGPHGLVSIPDWGRTRVAQICCIPMLLGIQPCRIVEDDSLETLIRILRKAMVEKNWREPYRTEYLLTSELKMAASQHPQYDTLSPESYWVTKVKVKVPFLAVSALRVGTGIALPCLRPRH